MRSCPFSNGHKIDKRICNQCTFQAISLCKSLSEKEMEKLMKLGTTVTYTSGELIYKQGLRAHNLTCQLSSIVKTVKVNNQGNEDIISFHKPVDLLGITEIISDIPYQYSAIAVEDTLINVIPISAFTKLMQSNVSFANKICEYLARKIFTAYNRTEKLTKKHLRGRLADTLLELHKLSQFKDDSDLIDFQVSRADLASYSNMTTSNAIRTLSEFARSGIVESNGKKILIKNQEQLLSLSKFG